MTKSIIFLLIFTISGLANGLQITNLSWNQASQTLTFSVSWMNSWHINTVPNNWDAAWIFVKFRQCGNTGQWTHGLISTNLADHSFGTELEPVLSDGSAIGIDPAPNNTGVMLRPKNLGTYDTIGPTTITIKVTNLPTTGTYDIKVFGIEMVFIPQEAYLLGTLNGWYSYSDQATYSFDQNGNNGDPHSPYNITSENAITIKWAGNSTGVSLPASFPKGYKAFHCMKYEISQGQYAAFLNTIPAIAATTRYPGNFNNNRNRLTNTGTPPNIYYSDRPDRGQGYLSWNDVIAYLDWAALRPMTEMEYEKICRGTGPVVNNEYAWGSTSITAGTLIGVTPENGTETFTNTGANCTYNNITYTGGDGGRGPVRVGIHAKINGTRESSGAAFYGVMDMSGNIGELVVIVSDSNSTTATNPFDGTWGDGYIDATTGNANTTNWPAVNGTATQDAWGGRGGSWYHDWRYQRVSQRQWARRRSWNNGANAVNQRNSDWGGRGVR